MGRRLSEIVVVVLVAVGGAHCGTSQPAPSAASDVHSQPQPHTELASAGPPRRGRWQPSEVRGPARRVDVYIARDDRPKPVVVLLHGSGCAPDFTTDPDGSLHETSVFQDAIGATLATAHVAIIERPGLDPLAFTADMSMADKQAAFAKASDQCSDEFLDNATQSARVDDAVVAITALSREPWASRIVVAGHSEGTHVVTGLLRTPGIDRVVAAAGLFASAGPIPFFGGYVARATRTRADFERVFDRVRAVQQLADDTMWEGLPGRRWRTFWLESTPIEDVRDSHVPLFIAQGSADGSTIPADLFALEAIRQQPTRPIRYVVVDGGNHAFEAPAGRARISEIFDDFLRWSLDDQRKTGTGLVK